MSSKRLHKTTSTFKRQFRRDLRNVLKEIRTNEKKHPQKMVNDLVRVTLRQRSGHYMKKTIRQCYDQIPQEHRGNFN